MAHGQWTESEARGVLNALAKSGLSVEAFARERGLVPQRISWWKKKLEGKARAEAASAMSLLPVRVVERRQSAASP